MPSEGGSKGDAEPAGQQPLGGSSMEHSEEEAGAAGERAGDLPLQWAFWTQARAGKVALCSFLLWAAGSKCKAHVERSVAFCYAAGLAGLAAAGYPYFPHPYLAAEAAQRPGVSQGTQTEEEEER